MLVSVSSVHNRPSSSVRSPLAAARPGTVNPAVHTVTALGRARPSASVTASADTAVTWPETTVTPRPASRLATGA